MRDGVKISPVCGTELEGASSAMIAAAGHTVTTWQSTRSVLFAPRTLSIVNQTLPGLRIN